MAGRTDVSDNQVTETGPSVSKSAASAPSGTISDSNTRTNTGIRTIPAEPCGRYTLIASIGRGGMGGVYLGVRSGAGGFRKLVVIKKIHAHLAEDKRFVTMFMDEARLAARMNHPNLVQTFEVGRDSAKVPFMAMEYMEGQSFSDLVRQQLRDKKLLDEGLVVNVAYHALAGLHYAHELEAFDGGKLNVVHRDISPSNIFVTREGVPKVLDFGIAKASDSQTTTQVGEIKGKYAYMSPEQATGGLDLDRRADIWAMGVTIFSALSGKHAFRAKSDVETIDRVMRYPVAKRLEEVGDRISPGLKEIIARCLERDIEKRYSTAEEVREALEAYAAENKIRLAQAPLADHLAKHFGEETAERKRTVAAIVDEFEDSTQAGHTEAGWTEVEAPRFDDGPSMSVVNQRGVPAWGLLLFGVAIVGAVFTTVRYALPAPVVQSERPAATTTESQMPAANAVSPDTLDQPRPTNQGESKATVDAAVVADAAAKTESADEGRKVRVVANERRNRWRSRNRSRDDKAEDKKTDEVQAVVIPDKTEEIPKLKGKIVLATTPWAEVYFKGNKIGQTPDTFSLPEGAQQIMLKNPDSGLSRTVTIHIVAGETQRKRISLQ